MIKLTTANQTIVYFVPQLGPFAEHFSNATWFVENASRQFELIKMDNDKCLDAIIDESAPTICGHSDLFPKDGKLIIDRFGSGQKTLYRGMSYHSIKLMCQAYKGDESNQDDESNTITQIHDFDITDRREKCCTSEEIKPEAPKKLILAPGNILNVTCEASCPAMGMCEMNWRRKTKHRTYSLKSQQSIWETCDCPPCKMTEMKRELDGIYECRARNLG